MNFQPQAHDWGQWSLNETRTAVVRRDELVSFGQALQWIEQVAALAVKGAESILRREVNAGVHADLLSRLKTEL